MQILNAVLSSAPGIIAALTGIAAIYYSYRAQRISKEHDLFFGAKLSAYNNLLHLISVSSPLSDKETYQEILVAMSQAKIFAAPSVFDCISEYGAAMLRYRDEVYRGSHPSPSVLDDPYNALINAINVEMQEFKYKKRHLFKR